MVGFPRCKILNHMKNEDQTGSTINLTPTWEFVVQVCLAVLENPDASVSGKTEARVEIMRLARMVDKMNQATANH